MVIELKPFSACLPTEIAAMGSRLPVPNAVPLTFIPSKRLIHLGPRSDRYFHGTPDEPWTPFSVEHHDEIAGFRHGFATIAIITSQTGSGPLDPGDDQIDQFGRHLRGIAKRSDNVVIVVDPSMPPKGLPECIRVRVSRQHDSRRSIPRWTSVCLICA